MSFFILVSRIKKYIYFCFSGLLFWAPRQEFSILERAWKIRGSLQFSSEVSQENACSGVARHSFCCCHWYAARISIVVFNFAAIDVPSSHGWVSEVWRFKKQPLVSSMPKRNLDGGRMHKPKAAMFFCRISLLSGLSVKARWNGLSK